MSGFTDRGLDHIYEEFLKSGFTDRGLDHIYEESLKSGFTERGLDHIYFHISYYLKSCINLNCWYFSFFGGGININNLRLNQLF